MSIKLYSYYRNSAGQRVRTALHLKQVPFEYISFKDLGPEGYTRINPQGLIPSLEIDSRIVTQSTAILEYIEERWPDPPLLPADPLLRAQARAFAQVIACEMHPLNVHRVREYLAGPMAVSEARVEEWYGHWIEDGFASLEEMLRRRSRESAFCFGDRPGMADLYLVPQLANARRFGCDLAAYPLLVEIDAACRVLPAFAAGAPENQPDYPGA